MDLIPGHWPVSDRSSQLIPGESPPLPPLWSSPTTSESEPVQWQKHQSPPNPCLPTSTPHDVFITACSGHTHNTAVVCYTAANNYLQSNTPWPTLLSVIHRQTKVSVVKCGNHKFMDCCCIHCCTMLLCFSRLDVTLVTTDHSHVTLCSYPRCLPAVTDCTLRNVPCLLLAVQLYTLLYICTQQGENTDLRCTGSRPKS